MSKFIETILAQCTPTGNGGIGIVRISGNKSINIAKKILGKIPKPRYAEYLAFKNHLKKTIDYGIAIFYKKPKSYTGEDILELQSHGGQKIIEIIIQSIINLKIKKVRLALPGEFTKRAFLNNKIDLIQAEAINDLIHTKSESTIYNTINFVKGNFSNKLKKITKNLNKFRLLIEAEINFPENINILNINILIKYKKKIKIIFLKLFNIYKQIKNNLNYVNGIKLVLMGKPNVGKSSLMNTITGKNNSIITKIPGTTRDIIKDYININNINIEINDTTGIHKTNNIIEKIGIKKTWNEINQSKLIFFIENAKEISEKKIVKYFKKKFLNKIKIPKKKIFFLIRNKIDLTKEKFKIKKKKKFYIINISIKKNIGVKELILLIKKKIKYINNIENNFLIKERYIESIKKILNYLISIYNQIYKTKNLININLELITEKIFFIEKEINLILGKNINSEDIINKIFSNFCIGK